MIKQGLSSFYTCHVTILLQLKRLKVRLFFGSLLPSGHAIPRTIEKETAIPVIPACFEGNKSIT